jgi:hypothetical protein
LKQTITEKSITANIKNIPQYPLQSFIASNDDKIIGAGVGPRRYQVTETVNTYAVKETATTRAYFARIRAVDPNDWATFLAKRDISEFRAAAIIETEELRNQQIQTISAIDKWWLTCYYEPEHDDSVAEREVWTTEVANTNLIKSSREWADQNRINMRAIPSTNKAFIAK